ncbi:MAG: succinate dehydrogenase assembly factor 2 [Mariprofundaceae bacterium]|nr:succinate dehydrogenase assembly factor 2 [Mariprofundaceae bacterium]
MKEQRRRCLAYRLTTQGMCELDTWLAPLKETLNQADDAFLTEIEQLLAHEVPQLQAMMHGHQPIPNILQPWLHSTRKGQS